LTTTTLPPANESSQATAAAYSSFPVRLLGQGYNYTYKAAGALLNKGRDLTAWGKDLYALKTNPDEFILKTMYDRATSNNNFASITLTPWPIAWLTKGYFPYQMHFVTGSRSNVLEIADYGEKNKDPAARDFFKFFAALLGRPSLVNEV